MTYLPTIGLEVHVQLATDSKAFCGDRNAFGAEPNTHIGEISLGYPGTLPVLNERQVEFAVRLGLALGCEINRRSYFERKNYFYADLPKGYQITQDAEPICLGGSLPISEARSIDIHHIHMEEDAGKSMHLDGEDFSRVDLNRAGTPLLEIVTEPRLRSAEEVDAFMSGIRRLVRWLGISDGNMEEGSLRCDVNVSLAPEGSDRLGTRCEIKNMNSMRFARRAVAYEIERQTEILNAGGEVRQETRQFDPITGTTSGLRDKEDAHDYRYFPDPDLPPVVLEDGYIERLREEMGELPWQAQSRLIAMGIDDNDAILIGEERFSYRTFLRYAEASPDMVGLSKLWVNQVLPNLPADVAPAPPPEQIAALQRLILDGKVSPANAAGKLLPDLLERPGDPEARARELGLLQNKDADFLRELAQTVVADNPQKVATYRKGKRGLIGFFMGEVMKRSRGSAEPQETRRLLEEFLDR